MRPESMETTEICIQNSRFIGILLPFDGNIKGALEPIKNTYKKATHYCYAFRFHNKEGIHDDGEPNKTAGYPILSMLKKYQIDNSLLVVVRYFGGIKLGTGGLVRAYQSTAEEVIRKATLLPLIEGYKITFQVSYTNLKQVEYLLKNAIILEKSFENTIVMTVQIPKEKKQELEKITQILACEECTF